MMDVRTAPFEQPAEAALRLWEEGFTVIPLGGAMETPPKWWVDRECDGDIALAREKWPKTPRIKWKDYQTRDVTEAEITGWANMWPGANWAILTGKEMVAVDADTREAMEWVESGAITRPQRWVDTAKGRHYWYGRNPNLEITNSVGKAKIDIRGHGGYVVAPGSVHGGDRALGIEPGVVYTEHVNASWPDTSPEGLPVLSAEDWAAINAYNGRTASVVDSRGNITFPPGGNLNFIAGEVYTPGALADKGSRNQTLTQHVGSWLGHGASLHEIMARAHGWNEQIAEPLPAGEVDKTVASVASTHLRNHPEAVLHIAPLAPPPTPGNYFLSTDEVIAAGMRPLPYLIRHYLLLDSLALIFGAPGSGKSVVAMDWAVCVALGRPWFDKPVRQGAVFYIAGEGQHGLGRRLMAWQEEHGVNLSGAPLWFSRASAAIYDRMAAEILTAAIEALCVSTSARPSLIVVDTLARNFGAGDENSTKDMNQFIGHIELLLQKRFGCCVLIVHHTSKAEKGEARGNGALKGAVDTEFSIVRDEVGAVVVQAGKVKDGPTPANLTLDLKVVSLPITPEYPDEPETSVVLQRRANLSALIDQAQARTLPPARSGSNKNTALSALGNLFAIERARFSRDGLDPALAKITMAQWRKAAQIPPKRFPEAADALIADGLVIEEPPYVYLVATPPQGS